MNDWKEVIKNLERYKDFEILEKPEKFNILFANWNIPCVQLHSTQRYGTPGDIVGFCGSFCWKDNTLTPLDGDRYYADTTVLGFRWFTDKEGRKCLDILVGEDW